MRSPRRSYIERARALSSESLVDVGVQVRVYRRGPDDKPQPAELLCGPDGQPLVWGGRYDRRQRRYIGPPGKVRRWKAHPGQIKLIAFDEPNVGRVLCLGAPGGGKSESVALWAALQAIARENGIGGVVAPTEARLAILWRKIAALLDPGGWLLPGGASDWEMHLVQGTILQFRSGRAGDKRTGSQIPGLDWDFAAEDEQQAILDGSLLEVDLRGRRAGTRFRVASSATNDAHPDFQSRLDEYRRNPRKRILTFSGFDNAFIETAWWENLRGSMSPENYRRMILGEILPPESRVYPRYETEVHVQSLAFAGADVTEAVTKARFGRPYRWIIGQDFGRLAMASVVLKCFADPRDPEARIWWVMDEVNSFDDTTADAHALAITRARGGRYRAQDCIVIADPHIETKNVHRSDYDLMRNRGFRVERAVVSEVLRKRAGESMINSLLRDANGVVRVYLAADATGAPYAAKTAQALRCGTFDDRGESENERKDRHDLSHWTAALRYGLYPFERLRALPGRPDDGDR